MCKKHINRLIYYEKILDELCIINSIIGITKLATESRELSSQYYGMAKIYSIKISEERNSYINMLSVLSDKVLTLEKFIIELENELSYKSTPTIAADK